MPKNLSCSFCAFGKLLLYGFTALPYGEGFPLSAPRFLKFYMCTVSSGCPQGVSLWQICRIYTKPPGPIPPKSIALSVLSHNTLFQNICPLIWSILVHSSNVFLWRLFGDYTLIVNKFLNFFFFKISIDSLLDLIKFVLLRFQNCWEFQ